MSFFHFHIFILFLANLPHTGFHSVVCRDLKEVSSLNLIFLPSLPSYLLIGCLLLEQMLKQSKQYSAYL